MKKVVSLLLSVLLLLSLAVNAYAAELSIQESDTQVKISIYCRVVRQSSLPEFPVEDGAGGGTLPDGTEIQVGEAPDNAKWLVVRKIDRSETAPYDWFAQVLAGKGSYLQAYEIYFLDKSGNRLPADGVLVTLSVPGDMENTAVYSVTPASTSRQLTASVQSGLISFAADGSHYYVLVGTDFEDYRDQILDIIDDLRDPEDDESKEQIDKAYDAVEDYPYDPDKSFEENKAALDKILDELQKALEKDKDPSIPQTGDRFNASFYFLMAVASLLLLIVLLTDKRRQSQLR